MLPRAFTALELVVQGRIDVPILLEEAECRVPACDDLQESGSVEGAGNVELLLQCDLVALRQNLPVHLLLHELAPVLPEVHALQQRDNLKEGGGMLDLK